MAVGSILIADDEDIFRESTSQLLRYKGFDCHCAKNAEEALDSLRRTRFDVLISDIRMPCNPDLRLVREARQIDRHLPVILVTGHPTAETAICGIDLSVDAYLTKPLNYEQLLGHVNRAVDRSYSRHRLVGVVERLRTVVAALETTVAQPVSCDEASDGDLPIIRALASCLSELLLLRRKAGGSNAPTHLCELLDCQDYSAHRLVIMDAIDVLEKTKDNFKSKQLGELRTRLERCLGLK